MTKKDEEAQRRSSAQRSRDEVVFVLAVAAASLQTLGCQCLVMVDNEGSIPRGPLTHHCGNRLDQGLLDSFKYFNIFFNKNIENTDKIHC